MIKASITSKGQITIPKQIRELLDLETGDNVVFKIDQTNKVVTFEKDNQTIKCPMCMGVGKFIDYGAEHQDYDCPVCQSTGRIRKGIDGIKQIALLILSCKYQISVTVDQNEESIPEINLKSKLYPVELLKRLQDYYQQRIIKALYEWPDCYQPKIVHKLEGMTDRYKDRNRTDF